MDNAATTRPHPEVISKLIHMYSDHFGNPSSVHPAGIKAANLIAKTRKIFSELFEVPLAGVIFCSSGTESDNLALKGVFQLKKKTTGRLITTSLEHAAIQNTGEWLALHEGIIVDYVNLDPETGLVDLKHLETLVCQETRMVSIQHINSETGIVQNLADISRVVKAKNKDVIIHSDGVQAFSRIPVDLKHLGVDLYSISAHKFHGIKGAGALLMRKKLPLIPIIHGGGQEQGLRSGTENVVGISAMGIAAETACHNLAENTHLVKRFSDQFKAVIRSEIPSSRIFEKQNQIPHIISLSIADILGEVLLHHLAEQEIYVSTGSACHASSKKLSPVLQSLGFDGKKIKETIRISMAAIEIPENPEDFFARFVNTVNKLKNLS